MMIPIFGLTGFHIFLVSSGRTTNEQVTKKFHGVQNPYFKGCCQAWINTLCGPHWPALFTYKNKYSRQIALNNVRARYVARADDAAVQFLDDHTKPLVSKDDEKIRGAIEIPRSKVSAISTCMNAFFLFVHLVSHKFILFPLRMIEILLGDSHQPRATTSLHSLLC